MKTHFIYGQTARECSVTLYGSDVVLMDSVARDLGMTRSELLRYCFYFFYVAYLRTCISEIRDDES